MFPPNCVAPLRFVNNLHSISIVLISAFICLPHAIFGCLPSLSNRLKIELSHHIISEHFIAHAIALDSLCLVYSQSLQSAAYPSVLDYSVYQFTPPIALTTFAPLIFPLTPCALRRYQTTLLDFFLSSSKIECFHLGNLLVLYLPVLSDWATTTGTLANSTTCLPRRGPGIPLSDYRRTQLANFPIVINRYSRHIKHSRHSTGIMMIT